MHGSLLDSLNPQQREAVLHGDGPLLVLAGAGSGKTRVLTHRLAHLVHVRGIPAPRLLAFTFTNRAAREMRERIEKLVGPASGMWVGTFHAICVRILRRHAELVGRSRSFTIYDADDQRRLVKQCLKDLGHDEREVRPQAVHAAISRAKNWLQDAAALAAAAGAEGDGPGAAFRVRAAAVYREYDRRLAAADAFDFDDLIVKTIELLRAAPDVHQHYAERFQHVLVDEYQDTNHAQYHLITLLAAVHRNLAAVGDDDQSIYSWRGADIRNILSFEETFPDARIIRLEQNYRSTRTILRAANSVVRQNHGRKPKELWTENPEGEKIRLWILNDEESEAEALVGEIADAAARGEVALGECVILYRTHAQSRPLEGALRRRGIRYEIVGGVSFYERREVKDILAYLRLVAGDRDDMSFLRVVNVPKRGIGRTTVERLAAWARAAELPLAAAARRAGEVAELGAAGRRRLEEFGALLDRLRARRDEPVPRQIEALVADVHFVEHLAEEDPMGAASRRENVEELAAAAAHFADESGDDSLAGFLSEVALVADIDSLEEAGEQATLMTAHNAKGLEFDLVLVAGLEHGLFPHASAFDDTRELEEERRLFYVSLTRARRRVVLSAARRRWRFGASVDAELSEFIAELPADDLDVVDMSGYDGARPGGGGHWRERSRRAFGGGGGGRGRHPHAVQQLEAEDYVDPDPEEVWGLAVGAPVLHAQFGRGTVVGQDGHGPNARLTVRFQGVTKRVLARYLSPIES